MVQNNQVIRRTVDKNCVKEWLQKLIKNFCRDCQLQSEQQRPSEQIEERSSKFEEDPLSKFRHLTFSRDQTAASDFERDLLASLTVDPKHAVSDLKSQSLNTTNTVRFGDATSFGSPSDWNKFSKTTSVKYQSIEPDCALLKHPKPSASAKHERYNMYKKSSSGGISRHSNLEQSEEIGQDEITSKLQKRIVELEIEIAGLRQASSSEPKTDPETEQAPVFQVFNRIQQKPVIYLGWPNLERLGESGYNVVGSQPIANIDDFLHRRGNVAFLVERWFDIHHIPNMKEVEEANEAGIVLPKPKFAYTCIQLYSDEMRDAFITFQQAADRHFGSDQNFGLQMRNSLSSPYPFWFHCRKTGIVNRLPGRTQELIKLLTDWIEGQYSEQYCETINMFDKGFTTAANMLYLIAPGDVFTWKEASGALRAYKSESWPRLDAQNTVASTGDPDKRWQISAWTYHYDGRFYRKHRELDICSGSEPEDDEELAICSLRAVPLRYETEENRRMLKERGVTFWKCRRQKFVSYQNQDTDDRLSKLDERYMVDFSVYRRLHSDTIGFKLAYPTTDPGDYEDFGLLDDEDGPQGNDIMLFPQKIIGYDMRRKAWSELDVDRVREVQWRKEAFHHLVIDEGTKDLIHALITNKIAANKSTDWIGTKGNGLIMLLHGGPGTGKTFTAESVAELAQKPLYSVTCGDIGTKPEDVEKYLESVLYLGKVWDCIVLLDEADVFLEQRTLSDLKRNALVSIFLRVLEYYEGIMILTSNRVGIFDEAFKSRIQLALHYERLGRPERSKIWRNFLNRLQVIGEENIDYVTIESYIEELSEYEMNGRQIRNAITTARQLAQFKKQLMTYGHLRHVIKVAGKFDNYIRGVHEDMSDDMIARGEGIR